MKLPKILLIGLMAGMARNGWAKTFWEVECSTGTPADTPFVKWLAPGVDGSKFGFESVDEARCVDYSRETVFYRKWVKKGHINKKAKSVKIEWGPCTEWDYENAKFNKFDCSYAALTKNTSVYNFLTIDVHCTCQIGYGSDGKVYWRDPRKEKK